MTTPMNSVALPPGFRVREEPGVLRIGWNHASRAPLVFALMCIAAVPLLEYFRPEYIAPFHRPAFGALLALQLLIMLFGGVVGSLSVTWLELRGHTLSTFTRPISLPQFKKTLDARTLSGVFSGTYEQTAHRTRHVETRPCVNVRTREGQVVRLVDNLPHERDAEWLAALLRERLGLQDEGRP